MLTAVLISVFGIVVPNTSPEPWRDVVGKWAGASAAVIAPNWVVTARHNSHDHESFPFKFHDVHYDVIAVHPHETADFMLLEINPATPLPIWACLGDSIPSGLEHSAHIQTGGYGRQAGGLINGLLNTGYCWGSKNKTWGENDVYRSGTFLIAEFDLASPYPGECAAADGDSGGPLVMMQRGQPAVVGIWVGAAASCSPCGPSNCPNGASWYGSQSYAIALTEPIFKRWIMRHIQPGDANLDGATDFRDLIIVLDQWLRLGAGLEGDVNLDGIVDFNDYNTVLSNFNTAQDCTP